MLETVWVLDRVHGFASGEIAQAIERTLAIEWLVVQNEQEVLTAMVVLKDGRGSFADMLIATLSLRAGCSRTFTY